jgi:hypothetical protein
MSPAADGGRAAAPAAARQFSKAENLEGLADHRGGVHRGRMIPLAVNAGLSASAN